MARSPSDSRWPNPVVLHPEKTDDPLVEFGRALDRKVTHTLKMQAYAIYNATVVGRDPERWKHDLELLGSLGVDVSGLDEDAARRALQDSGNYRAMPYAEVPKEDRESIVWKGSLAGEQTVFEMRSGMTGSGSDLLGRHSGAVFLLDDSGGSFADPFHDPPNWTLEPKDFGGPRKLVLTRHAWKPKYALLFDVPKMKEAVERLRPLVAFPETVLQAVRKREDTPIDVVLTVSAKSSAATHDHYSVPARAPAKMFEVTSDDLLDVVMPVTPITDQAYATSEDLQRYRRDAIQILNAISPENHPTKFAPVLGRAHVGLVVFPPAYELGDEAAMLDYLGGHEGDLSWTVGGGLWTFALGGHGVDRLTMQEVEEIAGVRVRPGHPPETETTTMSGEELCATLAAAAEGRSFRYVVGTSRMAIVMGPQTVEHEIDVYREQYGEHGMAEAFRKMNAKQRKPGGYFACNLLPRKENPVGTGCPATDTFAAYWRPYLGHPGVSGQVSVDEIGMTDVLPRTCGHALPRALAELEAAGVVLRDAGGGPVTRDTLEVVYSVAARRPNPRPPAPLPEGEPAAGLARFLDAQIDKTFLEYAKRRYVDENIGESVRPSKKGPSARTLAVFRALGKMGYDLRGARPDKLERSLDSVTLVTLEETRGKRPPPNAGQVAVSLAGPLTIGRWQIHGSNIPGTREIFGEQGGEIVDPLHLPPRWTARMGEEGDVDVQLAERETTRTYHAVPIPEVALEELVSAVSPTEFSGEDVARVNAGSEEPVSGWAHVMTSPTGFHVEDRYVRVEVPASHLKVPDDDETATVFEVVRGAEEIGEEVLGFRPTERMQMTVFLYPPEFPWLLRRERLTKLFVAFAVFQPEAVVEDWAAAEDAFGVCRDEDGTNALEISRDGDTVRFSCRGRQLAEMSIADVYETAGLSISFPGKPAIEIVPMTASEMCEAVEFSVKTFTGRVAVAFRMDADSARRSAEVAVQQGWASRTKDLHGYLRNKAKTEWRDPNGFACNLPSVYKKNPIAPRLHEIWVGGERLLAARIGRGAFSVAYRVPGEDMVYVFSRAGSHEKDVMVRAKQLAPENPHLPDVRRLGETEEGHGVYRMPYYRMYDGRAENGPPVPRGTFSCFEYDTTLTPAGYAACLERERAMPSLVAAARAIADAAEEIGQARDVTFTTDIQENNVAFDADGNIVLLDPLVTSTGREDNPVRRRETPPPPGPETDVARYLDKQIEQDFEEAARSAYANAGGLFAPGKPSVRTRRYLRALRQLGVDLEGVVPEKLTGGLDDTNLVTFVEDVGQKPPPHVERLTVTRSELLGHPQTGFRQLRLPPELLSATDLFAESEGQVTDPLHVPPRWRAHIQWRGDYEIDTLPGEETRRYFAVPHVPRAMATFENIVPWSEFSEDVIDRVRAGDLGEISAWASAKIYPAGYAWERRWKKVSVPAHQLLVPQSVEAGHPAIWLAVRSPLEKEIADEIHGFDTDPVSPDVRVHPISLPAVLRQKTEGRPWVAIAVFQATYGVGDEMALAEYLGAAGDKLSWRVEGDRWTFQEDGADFAQLTTAEVEEAAGVRIAPSADAVVVVEQMPAEELCAHVEAAAAGASLRVPIASDSVPHRLAASAERKISALRYARPQASLHQLLSEAAGRLWRAPAGFGCDLPALRQPNPLPAALTPADVRAALAQADRGGKHGAEQRPEVYRELVREEPHVLALVPLELLDSDATAPDGTPEPHKEERARHYAALPGALPPGLARYGEVRRRRGLRTLYLADGNHRAAAALLRGDRTFPVMIPSADWKRFEQALSEGGAAW